jgi:hypothetical protein
MISNRRNVVMTPGAPSLSRQLVERGYLLHAVDTSELRKAGGGAKCCVLELHTDPREYGSLVGCGVDLIRIAP